MYWSFDGQRAWVSAAPTDPLEVAGEGDFRARLAEAEDDVSAGRVRPARDVSRDLRSCLLAGEAEG